MRSGEKGWGAGVRGGKCLLEHVDDGALTREVHVGAAALALAVVLDALEERAPHIEGGHGQRAAGGGDGGRNGVGGGGGVEGRRWGVGHREAAAESA